MDREFIARNQIVERYFASKLPLKGAADFERYCKEHPELLDELHVSERVQAGLRLMEAGGIPLPWETRRRRFWERLPTFLIVAAAALGLGITSLLLAARHAADLQQTARLQARLLSQPLEPIANTRSITILPGRTAPSLTNTVVLGGKSAELADLKVDMGWSKFTQFRVTIDRVDQGRALVLHNLMRDSNGALRISLNSSALGPGSYQLTIEGMTLRGEAVPQAWVTVGIVHNIS
jgi:hypothetical protein